MPHTVFPVAVNQNKCLTLFVLLTYRAFSAFLLVRTGHLAAPVVCHMFCNFWQLPDLGFLSPLGSPLSCLYRHRHALLFAYVLGIGGFVNALGPLTSNAVYGALSERWPCALP